MERTRATDQQNGVYASTVLVATSVPAAGVMASILHVTVAHQTRHGTTRNWSFTAYVTICVPQMAWSDGTPGPDP
jgi:hypothetical protein